jgi:Glycosyl transferase family 11
MADPLGEKGIVPQLMGGLGNQMFTMSACIVASETIGCPLYVPEHPVSENKHNHHNLEYKDSIFKAVGQHVPFTASAFGLQFGYSIKKQVGSGFHPWNAETIPAGSVLYDYFQYYPALEPFEQRLRSLYIQGLEETRERLRADYPVENTAFLHVRRGDYLKYPDIHYSQPNQYYETALSHIPDSVERIYCFSDEPEWFETQPLFQTPRFQVGKGLNEIETLALMSLCTAGAVCANSTLSWWGAFLGAHADRSPVCVPRRWICDPVISLFPQDWIII